MKRIPYLLILVALFSCGKKQTPDINDEPNQDTTQTDENTASYPADSLLGEYIGSFGKNTIIISVNYISGKNASGYNILKGKRRNIKGEVEDLGDKYHFVLNEPGGDPYDGTFTFDIDTASLTLEGTWEPLDDTKTGPKNFKLTKRLFHHQEIEGFTGDWYLMDFRVELREDKSGVAEGYYWDEENGLDDNLKIPFSWFEETNGVKIEWSKNKVFPSPTMVFTYEKNEYEEMLTSGDYTMYRY